MLKQVINNNFNNSKINLSKYSLDEMINSKIYVDYTNRSDHINKKNYLIKNNLKPSEYITEIYFNIKDNLINLFNKVGIYDLETKKIIYKSYNECNNCDEFKTLSWMAKENNALVGIEIIYNNDLILRIRFLEAPLNKSHNQLTNKPIFSDWFGSNTEIKQDDFSCFDCNIKTEKQQLIYFDNMYISAFQLKYLENLVSLGRVYFKVGPVVLLDRINTKECCRYPINSLKSKCCKFITTLDKCSTQDLKDRLVERLNKYMIKIINPNNEVKNKIRESNNNLVDYIYRDRKDTFDNQFVRRKHVKGSVSEKFNSNKSNESTESDKSTEQFSVDLSNKNIEHFNKSSNKYNISEIFVKLILISVFVYYAYIYYDNTKKNKTA